MLRPCACRSPRCTGLGNDFIVFDAPAGTELPSAEVSAPPRRPPHRHRLRSGAGAAAAAPGRHRRVLSHLQCRRLRGRAVRQRRALHRQPGRSQARHAAACSMDSPGGRVDGELRDDGLVSRRHGRAEFRSRRRCRSRLHAKPTSIRCASARRSCRSAPSRWAIRTPSSKCPRCATRAVDTLGPAVENHSRFPKRTNVGFMEVVEPDHIRLRVFERGVGETQACGTGACAAVAVGRRSGLLQEEVQVDAPGGRMIVRWAGPGKHSVAHRPGGQRVRRDGGSLRRCESTNDKAPMSKQPVRGVDVEQRNPAVSGKLDDGGRSARDARSPTTCSAIPISSSATRRC